MLEKSTHFNHSVLLENTQTAVKQFPKTSSLVNELKQFNYILLHYFKLHSGKGQGVYLLLEQILICPANIFAALTAKKSYFFFFFY